MQAILYHAYGAASLLQLGDVEEPPRLRRGQARVRITRAALNPKDALFRKGRFRALSGRRFPKQCGLDAAGVVVESRAPLLREGDRVFGFLDEWALRRGTLAERAVFEEHELAPIPDEVGDEAAAGVALAGSTALQALRDIAEIGPGRRVLINGASGGVGTYAVQLARLFGAEVHSVSSTANRSFCAELGAHVTWSHEEGGIGEGTLFDAIFDVFGNLQFAKVQRHLGARGRFVSTVPSVARAAREWTSRLDAQEERLVVVRPRRRDLAELGALLSDGRLRTVIDSTFALGQIHAAFARLESKRARGKIIVEVG